MALLGNGEEHGGYGRLVLQPLLPGMVGNTIFEGIRHNWSLRVADVAREALAWIKKDEAFIEGTAANIRLLELCAGEGTTKVTKG